MSNEKRNAAIVSVIAGFFLTAIKFTVGLITGSLGIISEALHSFLDLGAALITLFAIRFSTQPPDKSHHYGHGKMENISAFIQSILLLITSIWIVWEAVERLLGKKVHIDASYFAFAIMIISVGVDIIVSKILGKTARKYSSQALEADALHYKSDILSSFVVIAGLIGVKMGLAILDSIAASLVSILVAVLSIRLAKRAINDLLDYAPAEKMETIKKILNATSDIKDVERIRIRESGGTAFIDLIITTQPQISITRSHELTEIIEAKIKEKIPRSDVLVHIHPSTKDETLQEKIKAVVCNNNSGIKGIHNIRIYKNDETGKYFITFHIKFAPEFSLNEAHQIANVIEAKIKNEFSSVESVVTHLEIEEKLECGNIEKLGEENLLLIEKALSKDERIENIHDVMVHYPVEGTIISCHVTTRKPLSLGEAHQLANLVEQEIRKIFPDVREVIIHTEPPES